MTITAVELEAALDDLSADALDHLGAVLRERARHRRVHISYEEAEIAIRQAPLSEAWQRSVLPDVGRVRTAARLLIERHWYPEQIEGPLTVVATGILNYLPFAREAVRGGIIDALAEREP